MVELIFLGSGGGRFMTITQERGTGGFVIDDGLRVHVDPGPGALVRSWEAGQDPRDLDGILVSHCHIDHCNDINIMVEAITNGVTKKRGMLVCSRSVVEENGTMPLLGYCSKNLEHIESLDSGDTTHIGHIKITATPSIHSDPKSIGFRIETSEGIISYISDTQFFPDLIKWHEGAEILIVCMTRPSRCRIPYHLTTTDVIKIAQEIRPKLIVVTHIGMKMHMMGVEEEIAGIHERTGIPTITADVGTKVYMEKGAITTSSDSDSHDAKNV